MMNNQHGKDSTGQELTARVWFTGIHPTNAYGHFGLEQSLVSCLEDNWICIPDITRHESIAYDDWFDHKHQVIPAFTQEDLRQSCLNTAIKVGLKYQLNPDGTYTFGDIYHLPDGSIVDTRRTV
jgi:hypothetical protein